MTHVPSNVPCLPTCRLLALLLLAFPGQVARTYAADGDGEFSRNETTATRLKLVSLPSSPRDPGAATPGGKSGFRYITIFVADMDRAIERLNEAGRRPAGKLVQLGSDALNEVFVTVVRDPEGNLVELVGPRRGHTRR